MWLLNVHTLKLEEFYGEETPDYAILSHTWEKEEITFQELNAGTGTNKAGYQKILSTCAQATKDGFEYCWIDTCCIDKSSSAELSEAINSMFRWYEQSSVCYAYLWDVHTDQSIEAHSDPVSIDWLGSWDQFTRSRWFTRGWTLQELIAPRHVVFFQREWQLLGTKAEIALNLKKITGIPEALLSHDAKLEAFDVGTRMSWAADRQTKRVEDIAYCLFGVFGVNLPLLYGEGPKAFLRLQEEIIRTNDDPTIFAWTIFEGLQTSWALNPVGFLAPNPSAFKYSFIKRLGSKDVVFCPRDRFEIVSAAEPATITSRGIKVGWPVLDIQQPEDEGGQSKTHLILPIGYKDDISGRMSYVSLQLDPSSLNPFTQSPVSRVPCNFLQLTPMETWSNRDDMLTHLSTTASWQNSEHAYFSVSMFCAGDNCQFMDEWTCEYALSTKQIHERNRVKHIYCSLKTTPPGIVLVLKHDETGMRLRLHLALASASHLTCQVDQIREDEPAAVKRFITYWGSERNYRHDLQNSEPNSIFFGSYWMYGSESRHDLRRAWEECFSKAEREPAGTAELLTTCESDGSQYQVSIAISPCPRPKTQIRNEIKRGHAFRLTLGLQRVVGKTSSDH